jgi:hypothetical protein
MWCTCRNYYNLAVEKDRDSDSYGYMETKLYSALKIT